MKHASLCTGIGGFDLGFERAGITTSVQSEVEPACQRILARRFPHATQLGDVSAINGMQLGSPSIISAGFPCQEITIASPYRPGLDGARSGLFFQVARLVDESRPEWVVLENTPGLLDLDGGRHMDTLAGTLDDLGYGWAYRLVDARHLGTTQRRPRVIVVGHAGGHPGPAWSVVGDPFGSGQADPARDVSPARTTRPTLAGSTPAGTVVWRKSARPRAALSKGGYETWVESDVANTLTGFDWGGPARQTHLICQNGRLRTLTVREWERLQGFPLDWTEGESDNARGNALGNAVHVGVAEWLAHRIIRATQGVPA